MKKRSSALMLAALLALALAMPAGAAEVPSLQLDGQTVENCAPMLSGGRAYLPAERLAQLLGAELERVEAGVSLTRGGMETTLPAACQREGRSYLPVRAAASALGFSVGWDRESRTVLLVDVWKLAGGRAGEAWRLSGSRVEAGAFSAAASEYVARLTGGVSLNGRDAALLSAVPLTDADTAWTLVSQTAEALEAGERDVSLTLEGTTLSIARAEAGDTLSASVPASSLAPAGLLELAGLTGARAGMTLTVSEGGAEALVTAGAWSAQVRWTAC